jgi:hypothetical protein
VKHLSILFFDKIFNEVYFWKESRLFAPSSYLNLCK